MSEKAEDLSESGEAIARAVHSLRDIGAGTDESKDIRSETHNGVEIRLNDKVERTTDFASSNRERYVESDELMEDIKAEFRKLDNNEQL